MSNTPDRRFAPTTWAACSRPAERHEARPRAARGEDPTGPRSEPSRTRASAAPSACRNRSGSSPSPMARFRRDWWHIDFLAGLSERNPHPDTREDLTRPAH